MLTSQSVLVENARLEDVVLVKEHVTWIGGVHHLFGIRKVVFLSESLFVRVYIPLDVNDISHYITISICSERAPGRPIRFETVVGLGGFAGWNYRT